MVKRAERVVRVPAYLLTALKLTVTERQEITTYGAPLP
jgi:hypothetical protein